MLTSSFSSPRATFELLEPPPTSRRQCVGERWVGAQHLAADIREALLPRQRPHPPILLDLHGVPHEMALHILHLRRDVARPVVIRHLVHPLHALLGLRVAEALLHRAKVLCPKRHPVPVHLQINSRWLCHDLCCSSRYWAKSYTERRAMPVLAEGCRFQPSCSEAGTRPWRSPCPVSHPWISSLCWWNEHGTIYAISSVFGDRMTTQHLD